jgi:hypothetical protein
MHPRKAEHRFSHVDAEKNNGAGFDTLGIHTEWDQVIAKGRAERLAAATEGLSQPVVINWGFPPNYLYVVRAMQVAGMGVWWIHANREAARSAFIRRGGIDPRSFEQQMDQIDQHWLIIEHIFSGRIIDGLNPSGEQRHPEEMWAEISSRGQ